MNELVFLSLPCQLFLGDAEAERQEIEARKRQIEDKENRFSEMTRAHRRRHQSRLAPGENAINPAVLFRTPEDQPVGVTQVAPVARADVEPDRGTGAAGVAVATAPGLLAGVARGNPGLPPRTPRFHTPAGHYSNPADNVYAATLALDRIPLGDTPAEIEARRAIDMLRTAVVQQTQYSREKSALHSTTYRSKSRNGGNPPLAGPVAAQQQNPPQQNQNQNNQQHQPAPAVSIAQQIVNRSRAGRSAGNANPVVPAAGVPQGGPGPAPAASASSPGNINISASSSNRAGSRSRLQGLYVSMVLSLTAWGLRKSC